MTLIPHFLWLNFSKSGISLSVHLLFATWNTRTGWYIHGPFGVYWREWQRCAPVGQASSPTPLQARRVPMYPGWRRQGNNYCSPTNPARQPGE